MTLTQRCNPTRDDNFPFGLRRRGEGAVLTVVFVLGKTRRHSQGLKMNMVKLVHFYLSVKEVTESRRLQNVVDLRRNT